jgi:hypothetical protein
VFLDKVAADISKIVFTVTIHEAEARRQNFGQVSNAFIRFVNKDNDQEVLRFDLGEDYSTETAMVFGEIYRHGNDAMEIQCHRPGLLGRSCGHGETVRHQRLGQNSTPITAHRINRCAFYANQPIGWPHSPQ